MNETVSKEAANKMEENVFVNDTTDRGLITKICKNSWNSKTNNPARKWAKNMIDIFQGIKFKWLTDIPKNAQNLWLSGKYK